MAVDKVIGPIFTGDQATGGVGPLTARLTYEVTFTTAAETAVDALTATDGVTTVPAAGSVHPSNAVLVLKEKSVSRVGNSYLFRVTCNYATIDSSTVGNQGLAPLNRPTIWNSAPAGSTQEIDKDSTGSLLVTSAKQTIQISIPYSDKSLTATMNEAVPGSGLPPDYDAFFNKVNNGVYQGYAAKRLLITGISSTFTEELYDGETEQYYSTRVDFSLLIKRTTGANEVDTWEQRILNEGTMVLDDKATPEPTAIINESYNTVLSSPVKLDANGKKLATNADPLFLNNSSATVAPTTTGKVDIYQSADFSLLGL